MTDAFENKLAQAMHMYAEKMCDELPSDTELEAVTFSDGFERKMQKIINRRRHAYYRVFNTAAKRAVSVAAAFIILLTAVLGVKAIREPVTEFIKRIFANHNEYTISGDTKKNIEEKYKPTYIPQGFIFANRSESDIDINYEYRNISDEFITISQMATVNYAMMVDNEHGLCYEKEVSGKAYTVYADYENAVFTISFTENGYAFNITAYADIGIDELLKIAEGVEVADE